MVDNASTAAASRRSACTICRKRKLKCDGGRPKCYTCKRLKHDCTYDEIGNKTRIQSSYVEALKARVAHLEAELLQRANSTVQSSPLEVELSPAQHEEFPLLFSHIPQTSNRDLGNSSGLGNLFELDTFQNAALIRASFVDIPMLDDGLYKDTIIPLGYEEALPTPEITNALTEVYFDQIHPAIPIIHRPRFYADMHLASKLRPPVCLRYAMWALAAGASEHYSHLSMHFYRQARKTLELNEMNGFGEGILSLRHCQTWVLLSRYEYQNMHLPRAWMSTGRGIRLAQMLCLHRPDGVDVGMKQCIRPPKNWTEGEERRRTFWMVFMEDRFASVGNGWAMSIDEEDITIALPASESAYEMGTPQETSTLVEVLRGVRVDISGFAGAIISAAILGHHLRHLYKPGPQNCELDINGHFWERHRKLDNNLANFNMALPSGLRIPFGLPDLNVIAMHMSLHTATIVLHQAALFKAEKYALIVPEITEHSKLRCLTAANEIVNILRASAHLELSKVNPFMAFALFISARFMVQTSKERGGTDQHVRSSLEFLIRSMHVLKRKNAMAESFVAQVELELGSNVLVWTRDNRRASEISSQKSSPVADHNGKANDRTLDAEHDATSKEIGTTVYKRTLHGATILDHITTEPAAVQTPLPIRFDIGRTTNISPGAPVSPGQSSMPESMAQLIYTEIQKDHEMTHTASTSVNDGVRSFTTLDETLSGQRTDLPQQMFPLGIETGEILSNPGNHGMISRLDSDNVLDDLNFEVFDSSGWDWAT